MLELGAIQPSSSPWASPVVLVEKKDGDVRFCVDYRKVNQVAKFDAYSMPRIEDVLDQPSTSPHLIWQEAIGKCRWQMSPRKKLPSPLRLASTSLMLCLPETDESSA